MNKLVIVVGASSGIGKEIAKFLSTQGYKVVAIARRAKKLEEISNFGIYTKVFDVVRHNEVKSLFKEIVEEHGKIMSLVYCAGIQNICPLRLLDIDSAKEIFDVNYFAALNFAKNFSSKLFRNSENASMLFISSIAGNKPEPGIVNYSASKSSINNLTRGLARELAPIRVNAIAPGFVITEMTNKFPEIYSKSFIEKLEKHLPLEITSSNDIAIMVGFLISESAKNITGNIINIDGGASVL